MSFSRTTLSLVTILLVFAALGAGVGWKLLGATADEGEASEAPTGQEADLSGPASPAQFSATVAQAVRGSEGVPAKSLGNEFLKTRTVWTLNCFRNAIRNQLDGDGLRLGVSNRAQPCNEQRKRHCEP